MTTPSVDTSARVAAIAVTYNRRELLRQCLEALRQQTHPVAEIIVVDNASTDGTASMVATDFPEVTLRELPENRGGAGGFHEGMSVAADRDVDWIWVMDDDAEPTPTALEQLVTAEPADADTTVALSPIKVGRDGRQQRHHVGWYAPHRMQIDPLRTVDQPVTEVTYSSFVGLLIRRRVVATVGLPEAGYFIGGDDVEYCLRLSRAGRLYAVEDSTIIHHDEFARKRKQASIFSKEWRERPLDQFWRKYYAIRNRLLTHRRHSRTLWEKIWGYATAIVLLTRSVGAVLVFDRQKWVRLRLLARAFLDGIAGRGGKRVDPEQFSKVASGSQ